MIGWLLIFAGGLLGSAHCVGMCGGFALALGTTRQRWLPGVVRQSIYGLGRVFTYTVGGAAAGFAGWRLGVAATTVVSLQAVLCLLAGALLVWQGLAAFGVFRGLAGSQSESCLAPELFRTLLHSTRLQSVFLGGVINGLLPCGLVYAYLALAAAAGDPVIGAATMLCFGLGTVPILVLVGCGGQVLGQLGRRRVLQIAAGCVLATGLLTLLRGIGFLTPSAATLLAGCPFCR